MALALVFLFIFGAFSLIPGGCTFFCLGTVGLMAAFAPMGAVLLVTATKEFAFAALQLWLLAVTVGPGRNDRRPGDKGLSTKSLAYRRDESYDRRPETPTGTS